MNEGMDHIAELQKRLYTRDPDNVPKRKFGILHPIKQEAESTWGETEIPQDTMIHHKTAKGYKRFFAIAFLIFIVGLGAALFSYYRGAITLSSKNVDVVILGNSFVAGGEELPVQIEVANKNSADLVNAHLVVDYPKGATDETGSDVVRIERDLGTVGSGKTKSEDFSVILYGEQGISRAITATLTYQLAGSSASFEKDATFSVMVSSSPVGLTVDAPTGVVSNQPFTITLRNSFTGDKLLNNVITRIEYPNGFVFGSATPAPVSGNNVWNLGDLQTGDERTITIQGKVIGEVNDEKAFRIYIGTPETDTTSKIAVSYNSALATLHVVQPFINGSIAVNNKTDDVVALSIGDSVNGSVLWANNSTEGIKNPTFTLSLGGDTFDPSTIVSPNSYYNALDHTITWTPDSDIDLSYIAPGAKGELPFSFSTTSPNGGSRDITLGLSIKGTFADQGTDQSIDTIDQKIVRFASAIQFGAQSLYSIGNIHNTGPYPPKADVDTTYTITWTVLPSENPLTNMVAQATLPPGVTWTGTMVPATENIAYDINTHVVTWNIGVLPKASAVPKTKSVSFQVKVRPTKTQIGSSLDLLGPTQIQATDSVANAPVSLTRPKLTTRFDTDPIYTEGADRVLP